MCNDSCSGRTGEAAYIFYWDKLNSPIRCPSIRTSTGITRCDVFTLVAVFRRDNFEKMRIILSQEDGSGAILYTSILFSDIRCRRLFRRSVVFIVSIVKLLILRTLVLVNCLKMRTLDRQTNDEPVSRPRRRSREKCISCLGDVA